ncbi:MAG: hypothetical protein NT090_00575 [Acidobacteria bacterium]|nr:hypothetical protein [Acidobacteriota bacterium]
MKEPHKGTVELACTFDDILSWLERHGARRLVTNSGAEFEARVERSRSGETIIRFRQNGKEYGRIRARCWGHGTNCGGTWVGMYCKALDTAMRAAAQDAASWKAGRPEQNQSVAPTAALMSWPLVVDSDRPGDDGKRCNPSIDYRQFYHLESYLFDVVGPTFRRQRWLSAFDFFCIVIWKANRAKSKVAARLLRKATCGQTLEDAVRTLTSELARQASPEERMRHLMKNWGFRLPMASAILTLRNLSRVLRRQPA